ncbi:N/A [soil metagenome]
MPIHPWLMEKFEQLRDIPSFDAALHDPQYGARFMSYLEDPSPWTPPPGVTAETVDADGVPVKVFRPNATSASAPTGALLWMHGGGFLIGTIDDTESVIPGYELAARAGVVVVSVGYRLAVDGVRSPAPLDDVLTAWRWLERQGLRRLFMGGASVGANLAVAATARLRDDHRPVPRGLLRAYPTLHFPSPPPGSALMRELEQLPTMLRFEPATQLGTVLNYFGRLTDLPAGVAPGNFDLNGLPETWLAPAEYDELRASAELFEQQLHETGVPVHLELARGMVHGFLGRSPALEPVNATLDFFAGALRA